MRKILLLLLVINLPFMLKAQVIEKQTQLGNRYLDSITPIIPVDRQNLLKNVDVIFNSRFALDSKFTDGNHDMTNFNVNQLRFEVKGKIHDKIYFRFRNRYTREQTPGNLDNISRSTDLAFARIDFTPRTNFSMGKLCADWGGYEFDFNPIDILEYNDIIEFADNFLVGAGISHTLKDEKNSFSLQLLNARTKTLEEQYGTSLPPNVHASELPLAAVANWRGSFFHGKYETTWSYSYFNEAVGAHMNYIALGNKFRGNNKFVLYYDFQYSKEGLDRKGITSSIIANNNPSATAARDAVYLEDWVRMEYLVSPKINLVMVAMHSNHSWESNPDSNADKLLSISYGLIPQIQYFPYKNSPMKFYLGYTYRRYDYTNYAETAFGVKDYNTGRISFGIIAPFLVL